MKAENYKNFRMFVKNTRKEHNRGKLPEKDNAVEVMKQEIWKKIPEDILEATIARLPIAAFFRFRSVCQKWNSLLYSQSFFQHCAQVPQTVPWSYTDTLLNVMGAMYDPSSNKWHNPTISLPIQGLEVCASAGGLVCFYDVYGQNLSVCNPLTGSFRELPSRSVELLFSVVRIVGMIVNLNSTRQDYKILWVDYFGNYEIYDSTKNAWCPRGNTPSSIKLPLSKVVHPFNMQNESISINSTVCFMRSKPAGIISFNMETETWEQFIVPKPEGLKYKFLAECDGRMMLVGLLERSDSICIYIWQLQEITLLWKEVDKMPNAWCEEFYPGRVRMNCLGNKGLFMMSLHSAQMDLEVTYNARNREWLRVSESIAPERHNRKWITSGTSFYPSLSAIP